MIVHLVDGTYELYRQHYGQAAHRSAPPPLAATRGVVTSTLQLISSGATHVAVSMDHVIESFRNDLYDGYKTSEGMEPEILAQIPVVADALESLGVPVWRMVRYEADDGLAAGARVAAADARVAQVQILSPDKDMGQCVSGNRIVQLDRRNGTIINEDAVREKFGVAPSSIADWLGLVGDAADGFPGIPGWGAKSASGVLGTYGRIEDIPADPARWAADGVSVRGAVRLAASLRENLDDALLFRTIATVVTDVGDDLDIGGVDEWEWRGASASLASTADLLGMDDLVERADRAMIGRE